MNDHKNIEASPLDKSGESVRISKHSDGSGINVFYKLLALALVVCFLAYVIMMFRDGASPQQRADAIADPLSSEPITSDEAITMPRHELSAWPVEVMTRDPNDLSNYVAPGQAPPIEEVIDRLHDAGITSGIGAFPKPGTSPPLMGLAVPEDYVLPEGYVRHSQATDDGQTIEAILMYSPDFDFFDSEGRRIEVPENRVVPNHMAPPGLPIRTIEIPPAREPGRPSI